jgi:hypothetical protein
MRALILLESAVVVALALGILLRGPGRETQSDVFRADRLIYDAKPGERSDFRGDDGTFLSYALEATQRGAGGSPIFHLRTEQRDAAGPVAGTSTSYQHSLAQHGLFPLLTPHHPDVDDRLWVWRRVRRETVSWAGIPMAVWRMDCIDPALPADQDAVVVYFHEDAPLFGIVRWMRNGRTYDLVSTWRPR